MNKRVVFMGTPDFACPVLEMLIKKTDVVLVVTKEDKKVGRKQKLTFSPIKTIAISNNIEVFQPHKIREDYKRILEVNPDIIITCAYGQIIPDELLEFPKYKAINVHASFLPKLRGGAPIQRAIMEGYSYTGITIMYMSSKMDEGDIIKQEKMIIDVNDNNATLSNKLSILGRDLLENTLDSIFNMTNERIKQNNDDATYAYIIKREDELIDFNNSSLDVLNKIRGLYPFPSAYTFLDNKTLKIEEGYIGEEINGEIGEISFVSKDYFSVNCKDKVLNITKVKPEGKNSMSSRDFLNGQSGLIHKFLGDNK
ncbi:MAG: methionyl-tRNA formyltransferase [Bacilli bacterium]